MYLKMLNFNNITNIKNIKENKTKLLSISIIILFLTVRLLGLGNDITNSDAIRWHTRSENFLSAIKSFDFKNTYQRYHPGITLMWVNSIVKQVSFWYQEYFTDEIKTLTHAGYYPVIHGISKGVNVFILCFLLCIQMYFLRKLFNTKVSLLYAFLIATEPYFIGINRWFHLSSFEVFFAFTSLFSLLYWLKENEDGNEDKTKDNAKNGNVHKDKYLILSSIFFTLSVLSKVTTLMLLPVYLVIFIKKIRDEKDTKGEKTKERKIEMKKNVFKKYLRDIVIFGGVSIILTFILFPALITDLSFVWNKMYGHFTGAFMEDERSEIIPSNLLPFYYLVILLFKLSPLTLVLFLISIWVLRKKSDFNTKIMFLILGVYYLFLTLSPQKIDRYALAFVPAIAVIISIVLSRISLKCLTIVIFLHLFFLILITYIYYPVYSAYYSPLFGGTKKALSFGIYDNSGEYYAQAAQYLNSIGRNKVFVPDGIDSFSYYYKGETRGEYSTDINYIVRSYDMTRTTIEEPNCSLDRAFGPRDFNVVFVFKCN